MRHLLIAAVLAASLLLPRPASAQVSVSINFDLPAVLPGLIVVEPGIQVVPQVNEEVFFVDGYYWARRDNRWWRSRDHRRGWVLMETRYVPPRLVRYPPGHYRRWEPTREDRERDRHEREQMRARDRERERHDRDRRKDERKDERRDDREQQHDRGRGHDKDN